MPLQFDTSKPRVQYDIAYACFLVCGLGLVVIFGIFPFILEHQIIPFVAFLWFIPISLLMLVVGVGFSIRLWRHAPLPILSALAFIFITVALNTDTALLWYGIIATVTSLWWFVVLRRRADGAMDSKA